MSAFYHMSGLHVYVLCYNQGMQTNNNTQTPDNRQTWTRRVVQPPKVVGGWPPEVLFAIGCASAGVYWLLIGGLILFTVWVFIVACVVAGLALAGARKRAIKPPPVPPTIKYIKRST